MANNEELTKALANLSKSVKSIQDKLLTLKQHRPTQSGIDPQLSSGSQYSGTTASNSPPPSKADDEEYATDDDADEPDDTTLVPLSEEAAGSSIWKQTGEHSEESKGTRNTRFPMDPMC